MSTENEELRAELARMRSDQKKRDDAVLAELRALREAQGGPADPAAGNAAMNAILREASGRGGVS